MDEITDTKMDRKIILMERDIEENSKEIAKLEAEFKGRPPAYETLEHFNKYNVDFALMGEELKNLAKIVGESIKQNEDGHRRILSDIGVYTAQNKCLYEELKTKLETDYVTKESSWAEKVLAWVGGIILTILVGAVMVILLKENLIR